MRRPRRISNATGASRLRSGTLSILLSRQKLFQRLEPPFAKAPGVKKRGGDTASTSGNPADPACHAEALARAGDSVRNFSKHWKNGWVAMAGRVTRPTGSVGPVTSPAISASIRVHPRLNHNEARAVLKVSLGRMALKARFASGFIINTPPGSG